MKKDSRVKAVISLDAVEHNFREMRKNIAEETKMIAVIKADAYGHGASRKSGKCVRKSKKPKRKRAAPTTGSIQGSTGRETLKSSGSMTA